MNPTTPHTQRLPPITRAWFSLIRFRSPLLTESLLFSLPVGTEMFHFPTFPPHTLYIQVRVTRHHSCRVSPFGNPRITARLTAPRGISQPPTSFIGSWCQGIHRTLLHTYKQRCSRPLCSSQTTHPTKPLPGPAPQPLPTGGNRGRYHRDPVGSYFLPGKNVCSFRTQQCVDYIPTGHPIESNRNVRHMPAFHP